MHGRRGAAVDYYRTVTGPARAETHEDPRTGTSARVLRVERLIVVVTCQDCWSKPNVQADLEDARRTGAAPAS